MSTATTTDFATAAEHPRLIPFAAAAGCAALADWLLHGWPIGISLALFLAVLGIVATASNRVCAPRSIQIVIAAPANWRSWGFRTWRVLRYLANNPVASSDTREGDRS